MSTPTLTVSIVSHGHHDHVEALLSDLNQIDDVVFDVILTVNVPDRPVSDRELHFPLRTVYNPSPRGFGANHNAAFELAQGHLFLVLNPDIRLPRESLAPLLSTFEDQKVGLCAPVVVDPHGRTEDSVRKFPTVFRLIKRFITGRHDTIPIQAGHLNSVDWVAGMFMLFRRQAFADVQGFDARRFFLYYEDVDICQRLHRRGWSVVVHPDASVVHLAQRSSHRKLRFAIWHATSAARYLLGI